MASTLLKSAILGCLAFGAPLANADDGGNQRSSVSAAFGRGLNTAVPPTNPVNHAILPDAIKVKAGGVVDFGVAGFHDIVVFKPGVTLDDLVDGTGQIPLFPPAFVLPPDPNEPLPASSAFLADQIYYRGINPAGGPLATAPVVSPSNATNRDEPVSFLEPGTYLVICNVRPHLLNGMFAYVKVSE
jgi:plastocyanin